MKPRLVIVSGWAYPPAALQPLTQSLAERWDVVVLPPEPATLDALASEEPVMLAGWSLGGLLALDYACRQPEHVRALALISATARFCATTDYPCGAPERNLRAMMILLKKSPAEVLRQFFADVAAPAAPAATELAARASTALEMGLDRLLAGLQQLRMLDLRMNVGRLRMPTLLLHGRADLVIPCAASEWLAARLPAARLRIVEGAGHDLPLHMPGLLATELANL